MGTILERRSKCLNLVPYMYGEATKVQVEKYKEDLKNKIFWLIVYKDKNTNSEYSDVNVVAYCESVIRKVASFNSLFGYPDGYLDLIGTLESARLLLLSENFDFKRFRKYVLDAENMIDRLEMR